MTGDRRLLEARPPRQGPGFFDAEGRRHRGRSVGVHDSRPRKDAAADRCQEIAGPAAHQIVDQHQARRRARQLLEQSDGKVFAEMNALMSSFDFN